MRSQSYVYNHTNIRETIIMGRGRGEGTLGISMMAKKGFLLFLFLSKNKTKTFVCFLFFTINHTVHAYKN